MPTATGLSAASCIAGTWVRSSASSLAASWPLPFFPRAAFPWLPVFSSEPSPCLPWPKTIVMHMHTHTHIYIYIYLRRWGTKASLRTTTTTTTTTTPAAAAAATTTIAAATTTAAAAAATTTGTASRTIFKKYMRPNFGTIGYDCEEAPVLKGWNSWFPTWDPEVTIARNCLFWLVGVEKRTSQRDENRNLVIWRRARLSTTAASYRYALWCRPTKQKQKRCKEHVFISF